MLIWWTAGFVALALETLTARGARANSERVPWGTGAGAEGGVATAVSFSVARSNLPMISSSGGAKAVTDAGGGGGDGADTLATVAAAALFATCSLVQPARLQEPLQNSAHHEGSGTLGLGGGVESVGTRLAATVAGEAAAVAGTAAFAVLTTCNLPQWGRVHPPAQNSRHHDESNVSGV